MNHETQNNLSPQGAVRRKEMLGELVGSMRRLHHRRRIRRRALSATAAIALVVGAIRLMNLEPQPSKVVNIEPVNAPPITTPEKPPVDVRYVRTDASITERYRATPPPLVVTIDDAQLVRTLIEIGRPAGLIRVGERIALSAPVTDVELHLAQ